MSTSARPIRWYQRVGPGLITACVVIGPGSILTSSRVGATFGYQLAWVVAAAVIFMMVYTSLGARLGTIAHDSPGTLISQRAGRWLAILIGGGVFFISAAFQFGNNMGVHSAFRIYTDRFDSAIVWFNLLSIAFLFGFANLYRALERMMMIFVGLMLICFAANLCFARPDLLALLRGLVPSFSEPPDESVVGLFGTTFVITAAYFQAYLVQQKGWNRERLRDGLLDARLGSLIMALITLMIMSTAAAVLRGQLTEKANVVDIANQLKPLFGPWGQGLFCLGLFSAAYSSFLINSMIGGFILCDGLGWGSKPTQFGPKVFTACVLLTGMTVALYAIKSNVQPVVAIVAAQAVTVVAAPLMAGALLWLTNRRDVMGDLTNGPWTNALAGFGLCLSIAIAIYTATAKVWPVVRQWWVSSGV